MRIVSGGGVVGCVVGSTELSGVGGEAAGWRGSRVYDTSGGVAREGWGYGLGERRQQQGNGGGQVSEK